jgi:F-type H+-transporting ATPase subunit gamma
MFIKTKEINKIKLVYSKFVNAMTFVPEIINIFPFDPSKLVQIDFKENDFDFEPNKEEIIYELMPQYITNIIYGAFIESKISENASRSNSMNTATDNANKMLDDYKIKYNRQRQSKITSEINEIVSGFNS